MEHVVPAIDWAFRASTKCPRYSSSRSHSHWRATADIGQLTTTEWIMVRCYLPSDGLV